MSTPDPNVRISNTDREAVIRRLHAATEEGRLELDEFAERSRQVYEAKTYAEVERLLTDLPEEDGAVALRSGSARDAAAPDLNLAPAHSKVTREGAWTVPARITLKPKHSRIVLDFREAVFTGREVEIEAHLTHSRLTIILPEGASAIDDGLDYQGGRLKNESRQRGDGPLLRLTGSLVYSPVKVRYERRSRRRR
ncbi:DUF1707 SHOCT-like domain-containing protein [Glycomyces tenuis]|uniref:DUF1707 SHOCT-like domain-containing protein n=1 Tax=Glycomyces tenuis TaxID=58116 RepID=UPI000426AE89|nr:DUF1707 domain-containing protein [Glycomyces tenuis]